MCRSGEDDGYVVVSVGSMQVDFQTLDCSMRVLINMLYYAGWLVCAILFGAVAYNRHASGALGLFELYDLKPQLAIQVMQLGVVLLLIQTIAIIVRITRWKKERTVEVAFAVLAWAPFIYNFSFIRG